MWHMFNSHRGVDDRVLIIIIYYATPSSKHYWYKHNDVPQNPNLNFGSFGGPKSTFLNLSIFCFRYFLGSKVYSISISNASYQLYTLLNLETKINNTIYKNNVSSKYVYIKKKVESLGRFFAFIKWKI